MYIYDVIDMILRFSCLPQSYFNSSLRPHLST